MPHDPGDPRVRKTRRGFQQALIRLILRKGYDAVTISDIAEEAETARITFYRHYHDKAELLRDCLNDLYEELTERTAHLTPAALLQGHSPATVLYAHIEEHEALYRILFKGEGSYAVMERLRHHMMEHARRGIEEASQGQALPYPAELLALHAASAQLGMATWWLEHDKPYPADLMAQAGAWISIRGIAGALRAP